MLSLVIAESALELVPLELQKHNSVIASARRFNKKPSEILLDISWHFAAMKGIKNEIKNMNFGNLIKKINPKQTIALSSKGIKSSYQKLSEEIDDNTCIVIGGFSKGQFSDSIRTYFDKEVSVDKEPLEAHIIISRVLYEYEKRIIM